MVLFCGLSLVDCEAVEPAVATYGLVVVLVALFIYHKELAGGLLTSLVYEKRPEMDRAVQIRYPPRTVV